MYRTTQNRREYIKACDVRNLPITYGGKVKKVLFGKEVLLENDPWMWHLHLKTTNRCNAKCAFCVEQNAKCEENAKRFVENADRMLSEMENAGCLFSVSVTGGEPLMFPLLPELCQVLRRHDIGFLTMNTNGAFLKKNIEILDGLFDFIDVSRHSVSDAENDNIFGATMPTIYDLKTIKESLKTTHMRIQCVLDDRIHTIHVLSEFLTAFSFADDISLRRKMELGEEYGIQYDVDAEGYNKILEFAFNHFEFKEQTVQDYYVYETYIKDGKGITFSYSDMKLLREVEKREDPRITREFILHPDGTVSGSWNPSEKVLLKGE